jgi:hypothetical protein
VGATSPSFTFRTGDLVAGLSAVMPAFGRDWCGTGDLGLDLGLDGGN